MILATRRVSSSQESLTTCPAGEASLASALSPYLPASSPGSLARMKDSPRLRSVYEM